MGGGGGGGGYSAVKRSSTFLVIGAGGGGGGGGGNAGSEVGTAGGAGGGTNGVAGAAGGGCGGPGAGGTSSAGGAGGSGSGCTGSAGTAGGLNQGGDGGNNGGGGGGGGWYGGGGGQGDDDGGAGGGGGSGLGDTLTAGSGVNTGNNGDGDYAGNAGQGGAAGAATDGVGGNGNPGRIVLIPSGAGGALSGHWNFNEGSGQTAGDSSASNNDGTLGPTASVESGDPAWACSNTALDFDGSDDEVKLSSVAVGDNAAWSISAWIKMSADSGDKRTIYGEGNTAQTEYFYLSVAQGGNNVTFYSTDFGGSNYAQLDGTTNVEDDAWHLVTVVQRSKTDRELYVGTNSEDTSVQNTGTLSFNTASIGYLRTDWVADPFKGVIDDVRIYDYALSTGEISTLNASPPAACGEPAVTSAVAEISPNGVITSATGNSFGYDIQTTISGSETGVDTVAITVPGSFGAPTVTDVLVDGSSVAYTNNTSGNAISVDLTTKVTASAKITVQFDANSPGTEDLTGVDFTSTVDDSGTGNAAQSTTEGNGDGDAGDNDSWTVTTTDGGTAVLMVMLDKASPTAQETARKTLMETWGYTVTTISDGESQAAFDTAVALNDVAYVSEEISSGSLGTKLTGACIGVVNEEADLHDELGMSSAYSSFTSTDIDITNTSHYITSPFGSGSLAITTSQELRVLSGTVAAGSQTLAEQPSSSNITLAVIEAGGTLTSPPGGTAAGRRVKTPWGGNSYDFNGLNADGKLMMRRAIEWATAGGACTGAVTSAVAEISPTDVTTSSTGNSLSYDIQATISWRRYGREQSGDHGAGQLRRADDYRRTGRRRCCCLYQQYLR